MENHRKEDRQTIIRQEDRELRRSVRVCMEKKKTTHDTICPVDHINHCKELQESFCGNVTAHQKNNMI